jgi:hypothetical protein
MSHRKSFWARVSFWLIAALFASLSPNANRLYAQEEKAPEHDSRVRREEERKKNENGRLERDGDRNLGKDELNRKGDEIKRENDGLAKDGNKSLGKESAEDAKIRERKGEQLKENGKKGAEWETKTDQYVRDHEKVDTRNQVTIQGPDGTRSRADIMYEKPGKKGEYVLVECKASDTAEYTKNQKEVFRQINEGDQVTVRGNGLGPEANGEKVRVSEIYVSRPDAKGDVRLERYHSAELRAEP